MAMPAEPILASALWTADPVAPQDATDTIRQDLSSGCPNIDKAIGGALQYKKLCCVSAEANSGGRNLCEAYVVSHLLSSQNTIATIIDSALSFDVRNFHKLVLSRLEGQPEAQQIAMTALERLKIMKVFDVEGLTDSIMEARTTIEGLSSKHEAQSEELTAPRGTIGDSEDEDEDEMLDAPSPPPAMKVEMSHRNVNQEGSSLHLLLIDSISHVFAPMMRNRYVEGQALLISFMRSLAHLTTANRMLTILSNDAVPRANIKDESPSAFSSCTVRPALGRSLEHMLDTHLLVHQTTNKTKISDENRRRFQAEIPTEEKTISVVEVIQDRHGDAFGRWAAFTIDDSGSLRDYN